MKEKTLAEAELFKEQVNSRIRQQMENHELLKTTRDFMKTSIRAQYSYNFSWLGLPVIQYPQDVMLMQEIIWEVKPDLIIETGVARGGSLILYASLLHLIGHGEVLGIDIDIRQHNRQAIESHPLSKRISLLEGSSIADHVIEQVKTKLQGKTKVLVCLDSNHTYDHVKQELILYSPFVSQHSYLIVFDTIVDDLPQDLLFDRPWKDGNNPKKAVKEFLQNNNNFEVDTLKENKALITVAPMGYLKRIQ